MQYQKLTDVEHVLHRPGMYIGSVEQEKTLLYISKNGKIISKDITYSPGLYKIFDEIIVNAIDHAVRLYTSNTDKKNLMSEIKVTINQVDGSISVWNNGKSIEIVKHPDYNEYVPEIIFGNLRSSENFDDTKERIVGGTNGYGSKCTNIFSKKFIIDIGNIQTKKRYQQVYENNLSIKGTPKIEKYSGKDYVKITFFPDFKRFNTNGFSNDDVALMTRRVYDIVACTKWLMDKKKCIKVYLNDTPIDICDFSSYTKLYGIDQVLIESPNKNWDIGVGLTDDSFQQVSFVNGIFTKNGGKHVDYIVDQITSRISDVLIKKNKNLKIKKAFIKNNLFVFIRCNIDRPSFNSQSKDELNTPKSKFGTIGPLSDKFIDSIGKMGLYEKVISFAEFKGKKELAKTDGKKQSRVLVEKYSTAEYAGTSKSSKCTLILTEGDSCTSDTPLLLKINGKICIKTIDSIENSNEWVSEDGREYNSSNYEIWTEHGWTGIKHVMRHRVNKKMYRILSHTGYIEVTEDHSLLNENGTEITPNECKVGTNLLHSFPSFKDNEIFIPEDLENLHVKELWKYASKLNIQYYQNIHKRELINEILKIKNMSSISPIDNNISEDEAYVMGFFWADGCSNIYNRTGTNFYYWALDNTNIEFLQKCKRILEQYYDLEFKIKENGSPIEYSHSQQYRMLVYGGIKSKNFVSKYISLFYTSNRQKQVPMEILNSNTQIRKQFFKGFYDGDGSRKETIKTGNERFDVHGKIGAHGLFTLCKSIGYQVSINMREDKYDVYRLNLTRPDSHQQCNPNKIKKIIDMGIMDTVVYDIETVNHHFQGGIGQMIVHNSAKTLAMSGLSKEQRKYYGVFPLKGKGVNVRDISIKKLGENAEINNLKKIVGLQIGKEYTDLSTLRYGRIMVMTDSDVDGSHIKGLLFNAFSVLWPSLFKFTDFLSSFLTPIVRVTHKRTKVIKSFYTLQDYEEWKNKTANTSEYSIKYYKGLGTSNKQEATEYFNNINKNLIHYDYTADTNSSFDMAFNKKRADDRKNWLENYNRLDIVIAKENHVKLDDFIHKDLIHFSNDDLARSIPSMVDGLKISQRKVLFCAFKRKLDSEIKVSQFGGYVSEHSAYHHGEKSLEEAIIGLAKNYIGTNNINLLMPNGQFGSRLSGKDAASSRYIFTALNPITKHIFNPLDFPLMEYLDDDGSSIEPLWYIPIIPMVLVNGSRGIGTGFSTFIPNYNPLDIIKNIRLLINGKNIQDITPWFSKFNGTIKRISDDTFESRGISKHEKNISTITELPIGTWSEPYEETMKALIGNDIKDVISNNTDDTVSMTVKFAKDIKNPEKFLKISSTFKTSNMHLFDKNNRIIKYTDTIGIIKDFYKIRLEYYQKRKDYILENLLKELEKISAKAKFILRVNEGKLDIKKDTANVVEYLTKHKYPKFDDSFEYLLTMPIRSMTKDNVARLLALKTQKEMEHSGYNKKTITELWLTDLDVLEKEYMKII
jgi:DNA gyrase/topoisomerase IV subunit B